MIILIFLLLAIFCFLYMLTLHLDGAKKQIFEAVFVSLTIATVIAAFFIDKWWYGLIAIPSVLVLNAIFRPLAKSISYKILGYRKGIDEHHDSMDKFYKAVNKDGDFLSAIQVLDDDIEANKKRLLKTYNKPRIRQLLERNNIEFEEFFEMYQKIEYGLSDIVWEIMNDPKDLSELIELHQKKVNPPEMFIHFRNYK